MFIYKLTNKINGHFYVGQTVKELNERMRGHRNTANSGSSYYLHNAMRYYGFMNFEIEKIDEANNKDELNEKEIYWIEKLKPQYNMHAGGRGGSKIGRPDIVGESRENWKKGFDRKGKDPWNKGKTGLGGYKHSKPRSQENRDKISNIQKNLRISCVHCGLVSNPGNIARYHNEKCKFKE